MRGFLKYCVAPAAAMCIAGVASADPVSVTANINVWHGFNPNPGSQSDPTQQALPTNPLAVPGSLVGTYSYTGVLDFANTNQATDLMSNWIAGIGLPAIQMSSPTFNETSLFEFSFTLSGDLTDGVLTHDDGVSLFNITQNSANLIPGNEGPTVVASTALPTLTGGDIYQLWYVASNGAPSVLRLEGTTAAVPEPATWALMIVGFGAVGFASRRARGTVRATQIA